MTPDVFSLLENIIFSMGQAGLSSVNLIVEDIEFKKSNSIQLIENLEKELDADQKSLDSVCFDLLKNYKVSNDQGKKIFGFMKNAESLERIGDICLGISKKINRIIIDFDNDDLINLGQYIKIIMTNSIVCLKERGVDIQQFKNEIGIIKKYFDNIQYQSVEKMKSNITVIPSILEYVTITKNLMKIYNLSMSIIENTINYK